MPSREPHPSGNRFGQKLLVSRSKIRIKHDEKRSVVTTSEAIDDGLLGHGASLALTCEIPKLCRAQVVCNGTFRFVPLISGASVFNHENLRAPC